MARDKKTMIGFDPLAWLDEEGVEKSSTKKKPVKKTVKKTGGLAGESGQAGPIGSGEAIEITVDDKLAANNNEPKENEILENSDGDVNQESTSVAVKHETDNNVMIENDQSVLHLHSIQDIGKSQILKNDILALIHNSDEISIEASSVERIDGSALQLLCALFQYSKNNNLAIHWLSPSEVVLDSAEILGIKQLLELN